MQHKTRNKLIASFVLTVGIGATLIGPQASAVVVQINGNIVPDCADNIKYALTRGELAGNIDGTNCTAQFPAGSPNCWAQTGAGACNTAPPTVPNNAGARGSQGPIDPVNEARIDPQVFVIPKVPSGKTTVFGKVTGTFLWRNTASYRNTFGWYNVGDDVTILSKLHPILPSWPPPIVGGSAYDQAGAGTGVPFQATVDFQNEFTSGRYKGGFVGFYLMTPEGQKDVDSGDYPDWDSCSEDGHARGYFPYAGAYTGNAGDPSASNPPPGNSCVGYMYFTERALNGDGNYIHSLIYQTKVLDANKVRFSNFYFTFEDTYRSNDLGYADNTIFVQGLATPCIPTSETCNGLDDDCDGVIDNDPVDAGTSCTKIPGDNPGVGICTAGTNVCRLPAAQGGVAGTPGHASNDQIFCDGEVGPQKESCNDQDDDCDGKVDDPNGVTDPTKQVWGSATGTTPLPDQCAALLGSCKGTTECISGAPICVDTVGPAPETCDGKDTNCNGIIDDSPSDVGLPCYPPGGTPVGICKAGTTACLPGNDASDKLACQNWAGPDKFEVCNGLDDDCNGKTDDNAVDVGPGHPCKPAGVSGVCTEGYFVCVNGARVCANFGFGKPEVCNGVDDDCNGTIDDNPVDASLPCGSAVGACHQGLLTCRLPDASGGVSGVAGHVVGDKLVCDGATGPTAEQCNGIDDDCNGVVDDGPDGTANTLPGVGVSCPTQCGTGKTVCKDGLIQCLGTSGGTVETCNGIDDDCNGIIDDNPIDAGGNCGTIVIDASVKQDPTCKLGTLVCRLPDSSGGVSGTPGNTAGDQLECDGQVQGTSETCNGIDDDCNGVVDDNVPGQGVECPPAGLTLPVIGECRAGKLYCLDGKMQCEGGIGPSAPVCDGRDHDCNGTVDVGPCKNPADACISGVCRQSCGHTEFSNCPGGTSCQGGYCVPPDCTLLCGAGTACNAATGECDVLMADGGLGGPAPEAQGGATSSNGKDGGLSSGNGGNGAIQGDASSAGAGNGAGGDSSGTAGNPSGALLPPTNAFGLATGGGGCACRTSTSSRRSPAMPLFGAFALAGVLFRRRGRRSSKGGQVR